MSSYTESYIDCVLEGLIGEPGFTVLQAIEDDKWVFYLQYKGKKKLNVWMKCKFEGSPIKNQEQFIPKMACVIRSMVNEAKRVLLQSREEEEEIEEITI